MRSTTWSIVDKHIDSNKLYEDLIVIFANDMFSSMKISAAWQVIAPSESSLRVIAPNASPTCRPAVSESLPRGDTVRRESGAVGWWPLINAED